MLRRLLVSLAVWVLVAAFTVPAAAQESTVKGNIGGVIVDPSGAVVAGAKITVRGSTGEKSVTSDASGNLFFPLLIPGKYSLKVEKQGFKTAKLDNVEVLTGVTSSVRIALEPGVVTEIVEVSASAVTVDTSSTSVGETLNDTFYQQVPLARGVSSLFYIAPGAVNGGAGGAANPSISGGSALENDYVADGVSITDTAFAGLGVFSRIYGSVATGINLSFVKEVQVKTGGFEPQYGKSTGGIVQIVTKSGGNEYHGAISAYVQPTELEARRRNPDDPEFHNNNLFGKLNHVAAYELVGELGGYVPHFKDKLFFFAAFDPTERQFNVRAPVNSGLFAHGPFLLRQLSYNYDGKLTYKINDRHQIESSVFGDPTHSDHGPWRDLRRDNDTPFSTLRFGNRDWAVRYNGSFTPTWLVNSSFTWGSNLFKENKFANVQEIIDDTQTSGLPGQRGEFLPVGLGFVENTEDNSFGSSIDTSKTVNFLGQHTFTLGYRYDRAFFDGQRSRSGPTPPFPSTNASGTTVKLTSAADAFGTPTNFDWLLLPADDSCTLCPFMQIPGVTGSGPNGMSRVLLKATRSEFALNSAGVAAFSTSSRYHGAYIKDSWSPNKYVTMNAGVRWEQERVNGQVFQYSFIDNWAPRFGVSIDPRGDRKSKIYANFGRYNYALPLDVAERSLTQEADIFGFRVAPDFTVTGTDSSGNPIRVANINQFGTVTPVVDPAHVLNGSGFDSSGNVVDPANLGVFRSVAASTQAFLEPISPGTKLTYQDEFVVGFEHEFPQGVVFSARYLRRDLKRIIEDTGGISPESALAGVNQQFVITNVSKSTDVFVNPVPVGFVATTDPTTGAVNNVPSSCNGPDFVLFPVTNSLGQNVTDSAGNTAVCFVEDPIAGVAVGADGVTPVGSGADGIPDGFVDPVRRYWAVEFEVNKSFSKNWQLRANWRIARLFGNFEGALRNDNGQTDPGISSLFDFTEGNFNLLGDQFKPGVLNTDRLHVINGYFSYVFDKGRVKGLTLGTGVKIQTGIPINKLAAHPVYENAGEVPLGGRGVLGRLPVTGTVDFHGDYPLRLSERTHLHLGIDLFNIGFARRSTFVNQNLDLTFGVPNLDFQHPNNQNGVRANDAFQSPFQARAFVQFTF